MDKSELKERLVAMEKREAVRIERERKALILSAVLGSGNVKNGEQVAMLIDHNIKFADGRLTVVNAEGKTRVDIRGYPLTIKELVSDFLKENPHFRKGGI